MIDDATGFWVGKSTNSNGPDNIPDQAMANTKSGVKRIFNDWEDGIYQQGDELVLNSSNLTEYGNIKYIENYDSNRNGGTGTKGDNRNYSIDVYAQWVKANVVYVASSSTDSKAQELNEIFGVSNIKKNKIVTPTANDFSNAITAVNTKGSNYYENYIVITDYNANSLMGYNVNNVRNTNGNGVTITSKYFGKDTDGRLLFNSNNIDKPIFVMSEDIRMRDIDIYSKIDVIPGNNEIYTQGNCFVGEYGIRSFLGSDAAVASKNEVTFDTSKCGVFSIDVDGYSDFNVSRASYTKVLSGHVYRIIIDRQKSTQYKNKYVYYQIGGITLLDILLAGPAQGNIEYTTSYMTVKDNAIVNSIYGGNQGLALSNSYYIARDCNSYINVYGNANITDGIFGGGAGRGIGIPLFSGNLYINVCGGHVNNIYGAGASSVVVKKTDGSDSNIYITLLGGKVSTIYGGGNGNNNELMQKDSPVTEFSAANGSLNGNVNIKVSNSTVNNIYGGGEGYNGTSSAAGCAFRNGDATITIGKGAVIEGNIYGGGKGFDSHPKATNIKNIRKNLYWNADGSVGIYTLDPQVLSKTDTIETASVVLGKSIINVEDNCVIKGNIYGGGENSPTTSQEDIEININGGTVLGNVYGGGYSGEVFGNTIIKISNAKIEDVFGGGYSATVHGNTEIYITSGNFKNIFGGGDKGTVSGNTKVNVGNDLDEGVKVIGLVYGGGRGPTENGDASSFTTVYGSSIVNIQGIKTNVENYGSIKLGAVAGDVDLSFKNYWTGNATAKYKTMNGIDRATNVKFMDSYVLLENKDPDTGELKGIKAIENLEIPTGSGIKISANGEITGNFVGGGELYLDSEVCLTVGKDISGVTKLILNPKMYEDGNVIRGGIENPYIKVAGNILTPEAEGMALISGEKKYRILEGSKEITQTGYTHFYISTDVYITDKIKISSISIGDKKYFEKIENLENVINITNKDNFSTDITLKYGSEDDQELNKNYSNIKRFFMLKVDDNAKAIIPAGTEIVMVKDGIYYEYIVPNDTDKISLDNFRDINNNNFKEVENILTADGVERERNQVTGLVTWTYKEDYKFVVNFANCKTNVTSGIYYPIINVENNGELSEQEDNATNVVKIQGRGYNYDFTLNKEEFENSSNIGIYGRLKIDKIQDVKTYENKNLYMILKLVRKKDDNTVENVDIPKGTELVINNDRYDIINGSTQIKLLDNLTNDEIIHDLNLSLDMSKVLPQYRLDVGEYNLELNLSLGKNDIVENTIHSKIIVPLTIVDNLNNTRNYGLKAELANNTNIAQDKLQLIIKGTNEERLAKLQYNGSIENVKVKVVTLEKKEGSFEYISTDNSSKINVQEVVNVQNSQELKISFPNNLEEGTYRIVFELYDKNNTKLTSCLLNFIVAK